MPLPIKLISTDFDGTIFAEFENPPIPHKFQELIADLQSRGVKWAINTGRDMSALMEALGRAKIPVEPDFLVLVEREVYRHDGVRYVGVEPWNARCTRSQQNLFERILPDLPGITDWINARFHATVYEDTYSPFCLIAGNSADADVIYEYLEKYCSSVPNLALVRNDVYARFSHKDYNKGTALAELTRLLGIGPAQVFAAGDQRNDLPMLCRDYAHWLATPSNAIEAVKTAVRQQGGHVSQERHGYGIADALTACFGPDGF